MKHLRKKEKLHRFTFSSEKIQPGFPNPICPSTVAKSKIGLHTSIATKLCEKEKKKRKKTR